MEQQTFSWQAREYIYRQKHADWFWALGIIAVAGAVGAFIVGNVLFGILILIGAFVLALYAVRKPKKIQFEINDRGIVIHTLLYPYQTLKSFWVEDSSVEIPVLLVESQQPLVPLLMLPLESVPPQEVRTFLLKRLPEVEHALPLSERLFGSLGF